ncbi:serine/threonine protein phosphatase [uncultured Thiohalocapsa sp.]|uniref:serine/threonine protein phosphatase n=1 Tax=uncultured Thiohalocapsa sp. TaxID=768990 RepID=UPI0025FB9274|nr:serine/threonine protein phosphatase [uncultured Thiohalocapsa sp.]
MPPLITALPELDLVPVTQVKQFRDVPVARRVRFNQLIVTGPPGSGKSTFIRRVGGWPEEGYVDLSRKGWWRAQALLIRPREIHLGLPFVGRTGGLALFEAAWLAAWDRLQFEPARIHLPAEKRFPLAVNWRKRFVFEFLLPAPERVEAQRRARALQGTHPVDDDIDLPRIRAQIQLFGRVAAHFHAHGLQVYVRECVGDPPMRFATPPLPCASM